MSLLSNMLSRLVIYFSWSYIFLTSIHEYWKNHVFDCPDLWRQSDVSAFFLKLIYFLSNNNSFTEFCCFLSNLSMNQPSVQFSSVAQSCPTLCDTMNCSMLGLPGITNSWSLPKPMSIESVLPSNHLILCHPLLLLPSIFPSIRVFSWVSSSHQVAKLPDAKEFQLQHQSFQWTPRTGLL